MVSINIVNLVYCIVVYKRYLIQKDEKDSKYRKRMLIMGAIFTIVAVYRSIFPSRYGTQRAWFDSVANNVLLIRTFAMAAELAFSGLIALAMLQFNTYLPALDETRSNKFKTFITTKSPYILIICIFLAQFFAYGGLITKSELSFAIEETLWTVGFLAVLPLAIIQLRRVFSIKDQEKIERLQMLRISTMIITGWCVIYCCYGLFFHILGIWADSIHQIQTGIPELKTGISAIIDAFTIVNESKVYSDWGIGFLIWHSAYFSICVWISIYLMQAPRPREISEKHNPKLTKITLTLMIISIIALLTLIILPLVS
ncbi:MAG: hypothetical protein ACTSRK_00605 [Promethearchaeota archaeon]